MRGNKSKSKNGGLGPRVVEGTYNVNSYDDVICTVVH